MRDLRIRAYNVKFGDAFLLSIPEVDESGSAKTVHVLIDVGNALAGAHGDDSVFEAVFDDLADVLQGEPLDLYVSTHEHLDHIQGILHADRRLGVDVRARHVWMTASSAPDYYERFTEAKRRRLQFAGQWDLIQAFMARSAVDDPMLAHILAINNPRSSKDCVARIRAMSDADPVYVFRGVDVGEKHPFNRTQFRILAPEEDTSAYYGRLGPQTLAASPGSHPQWAAGDDPVTPPAGVAAGSFYDLVRFRAGAMSDNVRAIDKAANNSSIVLELEWEGWRFLFPADAEEKSWQIMGQRGDGDALRPVHLLKVSHHGSHNGTPPEALDRVLPATPHDDRPRSAILSTADGAYGGVPDEATLDLIKARATLYDTRALGDGEYWELTFTPQTE